MFFSFLLTADNTTLSNAGGVFVEYTMDTITGTTLTDTGGNNINSTVSGAVPLEGIVGNDLSFYGSNDYVSCPVGCYPSSGGVTMSMWLKLGSGYSATGTYGIYGTGGSGTYDTFYMFIRSGALKLNYRRTGSNPERTIAIPITANEWLHLCIAWDGTTSSDAVKVYVDGILVGTTTFTSANAGQSTPACLGAMYSYGGSAYNTFHGEIDQFTICNRKLEDYEVVNLYNGGAGC